MKLLKVYVFAIIFAVCLVTSNCNGETIDSFDAINKQPQISPDYTNITIPPNIAPLNFKILQNGKKYCVKIYSEKPDRIEISSKKPIIEIPVAKWEKLLAANRGNSLYIDIYIQNSAGKWQKFQTITNNIADVDIDQYLVYRKIRICATWNNMGIYQRDLGTYKETVLLHNKTFHQGCVHCHSFGNNSSDKMLMQIRSDIFGTPMLVAANGKVIPVNIKNVFNTGKVGFTAWHRQKDIIAFSINKFGMIYHSAGSEVRDVFDNESDLALYRLEDKKVISTSKISDPNRLETMPEWSPDGKYLYFSSASQMPAAKFSQVKCDLMRISYDINTGKWGPLEIVLTAKELGGSITQPRFSPDGRFILFGVSEYSDFPIHQAKCDLHLLDVQTKKHRKLDISSNRCESWHGWSANGSWIVFNSKRRDGRFARPFFSYVDETGNVHKPFIMPQKDPEFYDSQAYVYNMPELITSPLKISLRQLTGAIIESKKTKTADTITGATPNMPKHKKQTTPASTPEPWLDPY